MEPKDWHWLGKRDALGELFALVRENGERRALRDLARTLVDSEPQHPNPHAQWYLESIDTL